MSDIYRWWRLLLYAFLLEISWHRKKKKEKKEKKKTKDGSTQSTIKMNNQTDGVCRLWVARRFFLSFFLYYSIGFDLNWNDNSTKIIKIEIIGLEGNFFFFFFFFFFYAAIDLLTLIVSVRACVCVLTVLGQVTSRLSSSLLFLASSSSSSSLYL